MKTKSFLITGLMLLASIGMPAEVLYVSPSGNATNDGYSWGSAFGGIQDALYVAYPGDTVWVAAGTYYPTEEIYEDGSNYSPSVDLSGNPRGKSFILTDGVSLFGGFAGNETSIDQRAKSDLNGNGIIEPWEYTNQTILSADFNNDDQWVREENGTWTNSNMSENSFHVIWVPIGFAEIPTLDGLTVQGGGCPENAYAGLNAVHKMAGGLSTNGNGTTGSELIIQNCIFQNNYAWASGGAIQIQNGPDTVIKSCLFRNNKAANEGGAIRNNRAIIEDSWFINNDGKIGGAVYNNGGVSLLDRCFLASNVASTTGGGALVGGMIKNCAVFNNVAQQGGGVYATGTGSQVVNLTVANNTATGESGGGGVFNNAPANMVINTLFWENSLQGGSVSNSAFTNSNIFYQGDETSVNNILISTQSQLVNPTDFTGLATDNAKQAKILATNWRLVKGSALINAGELDVKVTANSLYNIVRGDEFPDIGAAEYEGEPSSIKRISEEAVAVRIEGNQLIFGEQVRSVTLVDISGKTVATVHNTDKLSLACLNRGVYICLLENGNVRSATKILF
jgi:hypothetical protein